MPGKSDDLLIGLSIGTTKTTIIVAKRDPRYPEAVNIVGFGDTASNGIAKGIIVNPLGVQRSVERAFQDAVNMTGISPERLRRNVVVAFNAMDVQSIMTPGMVVIGGGKDSQKVEGDDLDRAIAIAKKRLALPGNMYPLHTIPVHYDLDDLPVENPLSMNGTKLDITLQTVAVPLTYVSNVVTCVEGAKPGLEVKRVLLKPLASALGAVYEDEMRAGCISICIGGGTTGIVLFQGGRAFRVLSIPIGGYHISNDLATVLHMSLREAEGVKKRIFMPDEEAELQSEGIDIEKALQVISARIEELFSDYVREALSECNPQLFPAGIILSGGVSYTPEIEKMLAEILQMPVRPVDQPVYNMSYGLDNAAYVSSAGILRYITMTDRDPYLFMNPEGALPGHIERYERHERNEKSEYIKDRLIRTEKQDRQERQGKDKRQQAEQKQREEDEENYEDYEDDNYDDDNRDDDYDDNRRNNYRYDTYKYDGYDDEDDYYEDEEEDNRRQSNETFGSFIRKAAENLKRLF